VSGAAGAAARLRLCIFNRSYWPDTGATGQLLTELAEVLVAHHGFDVTVVTGHPTGGARPALPRRETRAGVAIVRVAGTTFHPRRFVGRAFNYVSYLASAFVAGLRLPGQDVLLAMTDPPIIGLVALLLRRRAKVVFVCQDLFPEVAQLLDDFRSTTVDRVLESLTRTIVRHADRTIALGDTMAARLVESKDADPSRLTVIHNWADTDAIVPGPRDNLFSREYSLNGRFVVLHAGNIGFGQDLDMVLDAAERLRARADVEFLFVGDGNRRTELEASARVRALANVRFVPYQPRDAVPWVYASADVALVSLKQGLAGCIVPSKLYTILAAGRPVLAAVEEASETAAIVRGHACGQVVPPGDDGALARAILQMANDREECERFGLRARQASTQFSRRRQVSEYAAMLRDVAGAPC
jgi:glycosyltransferase involved in cell wall biosynthesis